MEEKGLFNAMDLASYIKYKYKKMLGNQNKEISPLKLQKSLYFCFAYWGAFAKKGNNTQNEFDKKFCEYLFKDKIEAWVYGPVIPTVYKHSNEIEDYNEDHSLFNGNEYVKEYIDGVLDDVLSASDFRLVSVSHEDKCWINHFHEEEEFHNEEIPHTEIINEYLNQV